MIDTQHTLPSTGEPALQRTQQASSDGRAVVAVFEDRMAAEYAVDALEQVGFTHRHIGFVVRGADVAAGGMLSSADGAKDIRGAAAGIITGGIVGGVLATAAAVFIPPVGVAIAGGLLASFFGGTVAGMAVGGMLGALKGLGVSEEESKFYEQKFHEGKAIVAVNAGDRASQAAAILARHGGLHIHSEAHSPIPTHGLFHTP
ncbi:MAG TPA: hypothetical protein VFE47_10720 [Tepidisphaeraceae bacterium]|jgi:hypothetical protein|nr:hypothetical protein [Tepidisphaeraceae bacterium]